MTGKEIIQRRKVERKEVMRVGRRTSAKEAKNPPVKKPAKKKQPWTA